jgi:hypothetical protein
MNSKREVIICDFDGTLYDHGLVSGVARFLVGKQGDYDIIIVTSRRFGNGISQIQRVCYDAGIKPAAICPGLGHDNPYLKSSVARKIQRRTRVALAIDNNPKVVLEYQELGITACGPEGVDSTGVSW